MIACDVSPVAMFSSFINQSITTWVDWRNVFVVAIFQNQDVAIPFIRFISAFRHLVTSLVHTDTLTIIACKVPFLAPWHLQFCNVRFTNIAPLVTFYRPDVLSPVWRMHGRLLRFLSHLNLSDLISTFLSHCHILQIFRTPLLTSSNAHAHMAMASPCTCAWQCHGLCML